MGIYHVQPSRVTKDPMENAPVGAKEKYEKQKKLDQKVVNCQFLVQPPHNPIQEFTYSHYWDEGMMHFRGRDGDCYDIPAGMMRYVNENCQEEPQSDLIDSRGMPIRQGASRPIFRFIPTGR